MTGAPDTEGDVMSDPSATTTNEATPTGGWNERIIAEFEAAAGMQIPVVVLERARDTSPDLRGIDHPAALAVIKGRRSRSEIN
jgi:hypothetical protein